MTKRPPEWVDSPPAGIRVLGPWVRNCEWCGFAAREPVVTTHRHSHPDLAGEILVHRHADPHCERSPESARVCSCGTRHPHALPMGIEELANNLLTDIFGMASVRLGSTEEGSLLPR